MMITKKNEQNAADWHFVREQVFINEQGFQQEFDDIDENAQHVTIYVDDHLAGCGRCFVDEAHDTYRIGRVAVLSAYRKLGLGSMIMQALEELIIQQQAKFIVLDAQCCASGFYERLGYHTYGEVHLDEHTPHIQMKKCLEH